jgi:hypothetical protein
MTAASRFRDYRIVLSLLLRRQPAGVHLANRMRIRLVAPRDSPQSGATVAAPVPPNRRRPSSLSGVTFPARRLGRSGGPDLPPQPAECGFTDAICAAMMRCGWGLIASVGVRISSALTSSVSPVTLATAIAFRHCSPPFRRPPAGRGYLQAGYGRRFWGTARALWGNSQRVRTITTAGLRPPGHGCLPQRP